MVFGTRNSCSAAIGLTLAVVSGLWIAPARAAEKAASMVIDANSGKVLHDRSGGELRRPASLTKIMTIYLALEAIESGRTSLDTKVTVSARAAAAAPSKLGLKPGAKITLSDAINALIVKSANDMAVAVAEHLAGSEPAFARLMTERARAMGMQRTVFRNASGLPNDEQVTTAREMLMLAMRLQDDFPQHYRRFSMRSFTYAGTTHRSHNSLLGTFAGVDGMKTGYTRASGFNLISSFRAGKKHVVAVVMGGISASARDAHMRMLLAQAIDQASTTRTRKSSPMLVAEARPVSKAPAAKSQAHITAAQKKIASPPEGRPVPVPLPARRPQPPPNQDADRLSLADTIAAAPGAPVNIAKVKTVPVLQPSPSSQAAPSQFAEAQQQVVEPQGDIETLARVEDTLRPSFSALRAELAARDDAANAAPEYAAAIDAPHSTDVAEVHETIIPKLDGSVRQGRAPSTLEAQMARLEGRPTFATASAGSASFETAASAPGGYAVQIGVYSTPADAARALERTTAAAGQILAAGTPVTLPLTSGGRQLYRARFAGFDSRSATSACNALRQISLDCFVARTN